MNACLKIFVHLYTWPNMEIESEINFMIDQASKSWKEENWKANSQENKL